MLELELILNYPLIESKSIGDKQIYSGLITAKNRDFNLVLSQNPFGKFRLESGDFGVELDEKIANMLKVANFNSVVEALDSIKNCLINENSPLLPITRNQLEVYKRVLHEYREFSGFHVNMKSKIFGDLSRVLIETVDEGGRTHRLEVEVNFDNSDEIFKPTNLDLPQEIAKTLLKKSSSLIGLFDEFSAHIQNLQAFFEVLDEIDKTCSVLDPEKPTGRDCHRRIYLGPNFSVLVTVNPSNPRSRPDIKFLGPEHLVEKHRKILNENLTDWNQNGDFIASLLLILGFDSLPVLPTRAIGDDYESLVNSGECSICFSSRLDEKLPEIVCCNKSCEKCYHAECLYGWLTSVNSKRLFNQLHGQCPNCEKAISCPFPDGTMA